MTQPDTERLTVSFIVVLRIVFLSLSRLILNVKCQFTLSHTSHVLVVRKA